MDFTASTLYAFSGWTFFQAVFGLLNIDAPCDEKVAQRALSMPDDKWSRETAYRQLASEVLISAGVTPAVARKVSWARTYPIELEELVAMLQGIPLPSGLTAMRVKYVSIFDDCSSHKDVIAAGNFTFDFPEISFEPDGSDRDIATKQIEGDAESLAMMLSTAVSRAIRCDSAANQAAMLKSVAQNLIFMAEETQARDL